MLGQRLLLYVLFGALLAPQGEFFFGKTPRSAATAATGQFTGLQLEEDPGRLCYLPAQDAQELESGKIFPSPSVGEPSPLGPDGLRPRVLMLADTEAADVFNPARAFTERCTCGPPGRG